MVACNVCGVHGRADQLEPHEKKKFERPFLGKRKFSKCIDRQLSNARLTRFSCLNFDRPLFVTVQKD